MRVPKLSLFLLGLFLVSVSATTKRGTVRLIVAVNAGGPAHRDSYGVQYDEDELEDGTSSDFGRRFDIQRVDVGDAILYQTERYSTGDSFGYEIPLSKDGSYVLVLKFSEVYFRAPGQKVFDVLLDNTQILSHLDIFREVGPATAHDEIIPFTVKNKGKTIRVQDKEFQIKNGIVNLRFQRGAADNPKINAFYVIEGTVNDVPKLPPMIPQGHEGDEDEPLFEDEDEEEINLGGAQLGSENHNLRTFTTGTNKWIRSGPAVLDPWDLESSQDKYMPVGVALVASFIAAGLLYQMLKTG